MTDRICSINDTLPHCVCDRVDPPTWKPIESFTGPRTTKQLFSFHNLELIYIGNLCINRSDCHIKGHYYIMETKPELFRWVRSQIGHLNGSQTRWVQSVLSYTQMGTLFSRASIPLHVYFYKYIINNNENISSENQILASLFSLNMQHVCVCPYVSIHAYTWMLSFMTRS